MSIIESEEDLTAWVLKNEAVRSPEEMCNVLFWMFRVGLAIPFAYRYGDWQETVYVDFSLNMPIQQSYHEGSLLTLYSGVGNVMYDTRSLEWKELKQCMP